MAFVVLYDAAVLYPAPLRDLLLSFRRRWRGGEVKHDLRDDRECLQLHGAQVDLDVVKTLASKVPDHQFRHRGGEL